MGSDAMRGEAMVGMPCGAMSCRVEGCVAHVCCHRCHRCHPYHIQAPMKTHAVNRVIRSELWGRRAALPRLTGVLDVLTLGRYIAALWMPYVSNGYGDGDATGVSPDA